MRIGIDVGGTHTDAVLVDGRHVLAEVKAPTTADVTSGIVTALRRLTEAHPDATRAAGVMIGTTHFTNALVEGRSLVPTAAVRLGLPATASLPPMVDWPERVRALLGGHVYLCHGGSEFDGRAISPLDRKELRRVGADIAAKGIRSIAVSSVFSPVSSEHEEEAAEILAVEAPEALVSLSHEIGRIGLLERENATIVNACLRELAAHVIGAFRGAVSEHGIAAPVYLTQNDGTLMSVDYAERYPVATFASGPTNSMRGAAFLSELEDCAVVDLGGTTADIGVLVHGFPREASLAVNIGGVRTNFRMPDVVSLGVGGGSVVRRDGVLTVGPDSVGYELPRRALVFGGNTLTATDLAVAVGAASIGEPERVASLERALVEEGLALVERSIADGLERMKTTAAAVPVVVVGGGSILVGERLRGATEVVKPKHFAVANAIGAAIAQAGGETDRIFRLDGTSRDAVLDEAVAQASQRAVDAGARPDTVRVVDVDEVPLAYLPGNATRIRVKAVGELELGLTGVAATAAD
ncbi:MAG: hydantoinase/oxoprolinase N-terminal domain-containing protein [Gaiellaceae bacterium]